MKIRSVLTCECKRGVCIRCYGRNLASGRLVETGRGRRRDRGAVDRRAGHAADDAHVPHRRNRAHRGAERHRGAATPAPCATRTSRPSRAATGSPVAINRNGRGRDPGSRGARARALQRRVRRDARACGTATRSSAARRSPSGTRTTSSILTDVAGTIRFHDIEAGVTMKEEVEEVSGLVAPGDHPVPGRKAAPAAARARREGARASARSCCRCTRRSWSRTAAEVGPGRRPGQDPARDDEDQGHHRRSAARRRPVRGAAPQGPGGDGRGRRRRALRRDRQGLAQDRGPDGRRRGARVQHPQGAARHGARRASACAPATRSPTARRTRTRSWRSWASASCRSTCSTGSRRSTGSRA